MELVNFSGKNKIFHIHIQTGHIKDDIMQNHEGKQKKFKMKFQDSMDKANFFFGTLPFSPWVVLAMWLHMGAPQKKHGK